MAKAMRAVRSSNRRYREWKKAGVKDEVSITDDRGNQ